MLLIIRQTRKGFWEDEDWMPSAQRRFLGTLWWVSYFVFFSALLLSFCLGSCLLVGWPGF